MTIEDRSERSMPRWFFPMALGVIVTGVVITIYLYTNPPAPPPNPLRFPVPQKIIGEHTVKAGGSVIVEGTKCNDSDKPVTFRGDSVLQSRSDSTSRPGQPTATVIHYTTGLPQVLLPNDCITRTFTNVLPDDIPPDTWRIAGQACLVNDSSICVSWFTEEFRIVP